MILRRHGGTNRHQPVRALALILALALIAAAAPDPSQPTDVPTSRSSDPKATMRLEEIRPVPEFGRAITTQPDPTSREPHPLAQRHLRKGRKRFNEGLWADAISEFEKALEFDPNLTEARLLFARAAIQFGDDNRAETRLRAVLKYHPRNLVAHQLLGEIAWRRRKPLEAITELRLALIAGADDPNLPEMILARRTLASALREAGYLSAAATQLHAYIEAIDQPTQAMRDHPELRDVMERDRLKAIDTLATLQSELGAYAESAEAWRRALAAQPDDVRLRRRLAYALARAGRTDEALEAARRWCLALPQPTDGLDTLKEICRLLDRPEQYENELIRLTESANNPKMTIDLANLLLDQGKQAEARALLERASAKGSLGARGGYLLARLHARTDQPAESYRVLIETLRKNPQTEGRAMQLLEGRVPEIQLPEFMESAERMAVARPEDAFARFGLGFLFMLRKEEDRATDELKAAVELDKSFGAPRAALARLAVRRKHWDEAITLADRAIADGIQSAPLQFYKALAHDALDENTAAESAFLESFSLDRSSPLPLFHLALSYDRRGEIQRCEELYRRILDDVDPRFMPARERLLIWYLNRGRINKCREYFSDFEKLEQSGPIVERCRAMLALTTSKADTAKSRLDEYVRALRAILEDHPDDAPTWLELARSYNTVHDFDRALEHVEASLRIDPDSLPARNLKAALLVKKLEFDRAAKTVEGLLVDRPRDAAYLQKLLEIAYDRADFQAAVDLLKRLIGRDDLKHRRNVFTSQLIAALKQADRLDEAMMTAKQWLAEAPKDRVRRRTYLSALARAGRHDQAVDLANRYLEEAPDDATARIQLLLQLRSARRYLEAQQRALAWLADDGEDIDLNAELIQLCWNMKQWDDAIDIARTGAELPDHRARYMSWLGESFRRARRYDEAVDFYREKADQLETETAYRALLFVLIEAERFDEAERVTNKVLRPHLDARDDGRLYDAGLVRRMRSLLAEIYQNTGRETQAFDQLEQCYQSDPNDPVINNNLGYTWADAGMNLERAEKMIRFALSQDPRSAANLDSLGWVLYKQGKWDESLRFLLRSRRLSERDDPVILDHLADTLYRLGKHDAARSLWQKAFDLCDPASDPPPNRELRLLRGGIQSKIRAFDAGDPAPTAPVIEPAPTTQPTTAPAS